MTMPTVTGTCHVPMIRWSTQQPAAFLSVRHICAIRGLQSDVTDAGRMRGARCVNGVASHSRIP